MSEAAVTGEQEVEIGEWRRVSKLTLAVNTLRTAGQALIPLVFAFYSVLGKDDAKQVPALLIALGALTLFVLMVGAPWLSWYRLRYRIGANDVRLEQGIISRSARSVPYDRIQDVSLEQKLIPRILGLVEVKFETGAGGKDELKLSYVSETEGEKLRDTVREMVDGENAPADPDGTPDGVDAVAETAAETLFAMNPKRLFTFGLFNFSLVVFAVLLGAMQQLEFLLPFDPWDAVADWFRDDGFADAGALVSGYGMAAQIVALVYSIAAVIVVGMASGIVTTFLRDWEFRLDRTPKGFRRRRGLLTKTDVVMPIHRVQALVLKTGFIRRLFGWHGLSFISLAQDSRNANHDVAPFAKLHELQPIVDASGFSLPGTDVAWCRPSVKYRVDRMVLSSGISFFTALAFLIAKAILPPGAQGIGIGAAIMAVLGVIFALQQAFLWRYQRHAVDALFVYTRRGWLAPRTDVASRIRLQSIEIAQGPLAGLRGYCALKFGLAGGNFAIEGLPVEEARAIRAKVLESIAAVDFAKLPR
ncbi:MAG: PH domain-containing protein [Alteraurantiacibacter sp.]